ncbi:MAG: PepSY-like domain-containing protein [Ferruginibacter sp.]
MKKIIIIITILAFNISIDAQTIDASKVPAIVKEGFAKHFAGVSGKWEKERDMYEVSFKQNNNKMSALFDANGTITETEMAINSKDLPEPVITYINGHYKGKKIEEASKITKADGTVIYEAEVDEADLLFDVNGKFIKVEKQDKEEKNEQD